MIKHIDNIEAIENLNSANYRPINEDQVAALMASIREIGLQEPIKVFEIKDTKERFIICGHHRAEAIRRLREANATIFYNLPTELKRGTREELESQSTIVGSIVSNMFRTDMTVFERAAAYQKLVDAGLTVQEIARRLTKDRKTVTNGLAVAALPLEVKDWIADNKISDSRVYSVARAYKRDPSIDCIAKLRKSPQTKNGLTAKRMIQVDIDQLVEKLKQAKLGDSTIERIINVL